MCKREWRMHSEPWVPRVVGGLKCEDNVHCTRQVVADDKALITVEGVSKVVARGRKSTG